VSNRTALGHAQFTALALQPIGNDRVVLHDRPMALAVEAPLSGRAAEVRIAFLRPHRFHPRLVAEESRREVIGGRSSFTNSFHFPYGERLASTDAAEPAGSSR